MDSSSLFILDQFYIDSLIEQMEICHSNMSWGYYTYISTGIRCGSCGSGIKEVTCLSDMLFFLNEYTLGVDDEHDIDSIKEQAMMFCDFSEIDLGLAGTPLLYEDGNLIVSESGEIPFIEED